MPYGEPGECYKPCHLPRSPHSDLEKNGEDCPSYEDLLQRLMRRHLKDKMQKETAEESSESPHNSTNNEDAISANQLSDELVVEIPRDQSKNLRSPPLSSGSNGQDLSSNASDIESDLPSSVNSSSYADNAKPDQGEDNSDSLTIDSHHEISLPSAKTHSTDPSSASRSSNFVPEDSDDDGSEDEGERDDGSISTTSSSLPTTAPIISTSLSNTKYGAKNHPLLPLICIIVHLLFCCN